MKHLIKSNINAIFVNETKNGDTEKNFELLIQYFLSLKNEEDQKNFIEEINSFINKIEESISIEFNTNKTRVRGSGKLCIKTMIYFGLLENKLHSYLYHDWRKFYSLLFSYEDILFHLNGEEKNHYAEILSEIITKLDRNSGIGSNIYDLINIANNFILEWRLGNIKLEINQLDIEINSDQNQVIELIEEFGLNPEFNKFLTELKQKDISDEDEIQFAGTIATYREFFGKIIIEISNKIAEFHQESIPQYQSGDGKNLGEVSNSRAYIKEKIGLSPKDNKFIDSYVDILHKEGGHNMFSSKGYFRLTKNIGIEILYMLLSKTKEFNQ